MSQTVILMVIIGFVSYAAWQNPSRMQKWILNPYRAFHDKEYFRFITSGFIHANWGHLIFNLFTLYFFGKNVEYTFIQLLGTTGGIIAFWILFLTAVIVSDIPSFVKFRNIPSYNSLGASGGVSALVFSSIIFYPLQPIYILFIPFGIPGFILGGLYLLYSYYQGRNLGDNINHDAHLFGALYGVLFTVILFPQAISTFFDQISSFSIGI